MSDILSSCESMNKKLDSYISEFNKIKGPISDLKSDMDLSLDNIKDETGVDDLDSSLNQKENELKNSLNDTMDAAKKLTGSCLDGIMSAINNGLNDINNLTSNALTLPDLDFLNPVTEVMGLMKTLLEESGLQNLLSKIDELLGCLADDNECIPIDKLDNTISNVNSFLDVNSLSSSGEFDIDSLLEDFENPALKENIKSVSKKADTMKEEVQKLAESTNKYANPLKW